MFKKDVKVPLQEAELVGTSSSNSDEDKSNKYQQHRCVLVPIHNKSNDLI